MSVSKMVQLIRVWKLASYPAKVKAGFFQGGPALPSEMQAAESQSSESWLCFLLKPGQKAA